MHPLTPLTDEQWQQIEPLFPPLVKRRRGKPHAPWRIVVNAVLFALFAGGKWNAIPKTADFASKSAAHRWFLEWEKKGLLDEILKRISPPGASLPPLFRRNRKKATPPPTLPTSSEQSA